MKNAQQPSLLQTKEWQKLQEELGETCFWETAGPAKDPDWQFLAIKKTTPFGAYLYLPYGPYVKEKKSAKACYEKMMAVAEQEQAFFVRIEPQQTEAVKDWLKKPNCKKAKDVNPAETLKIDISGDEEAIIAGYSRRNKGYAKNFGKKGVAVRISENPEDIKYLIKFQHELAALKGISTFADEYLKTELNQSFACLYLSYYDKKQDVSESQKERPKDQQILAATLFFDGQGARHYMQSASDKRYNHLPATLGIVHTAMMDAKKAGLTTFDFWGIAPEGAKPDHPWYGFTEFKKSFGGEEVYYAGTHDLVLNKWKYRPYVMMRKANLALRKLKSRVAR